MSHIGVFTAYQPYVVLGQEGIGRLLVFIMKGMLNNGHELTILAPSWHRKEVKKLLKEHSLEKRIKIKTVRMHPPIMLMIYDLMLWWRVRKAEGEDDTSMEQDEDEEKKEKITFFGALRKFTFARLSSYSLPLFLVYAVLILAIYIVLFPFLLIIVPFWLLKKWYAYDYDPDSNSGKAKRFIKEKLNLYLSFVPRNLRSDVIALGIMNAARSYEIKKMVKYVNKGDINYWYVPSVFWKEALKIRKKRVIVVPDLVYAEFPQCYYSESVVPMNARNIEFFLKKKPPVICYSNHVKDRHLVQLRDISPKRITVIPHGVVDLSEHLKRGLPPKEIIEVYLRRKGHSVPNITFLRNYNFEEGRFIIYSSQYRFHKNIIGLLHVLEILLRREHININLVLTCSNYAELQPVLEKMNLTREVIFMPHVPENVLAALNALALLHVNPTLFEGGFPFTFDEAYSVGTPSVMSDIPVTREYVDDELAKYMLFDPYDYEDFAAKVKWGLEHREELLAMQKPLFEKFAQRSWDTVADEYYKAMRCSYRRKLPKRKRKPWKRS